MSLLLFTRRLFVLLFVCLLFGLSLDSVRLQAQTNLQSSLETQIQTWNTQVRAIQRQVEMDRVIQHEAESWTSELQSIRDAATEEGLKLDEQIVSLRLQLQAIDPADTEKEVSDAAIETDGSKQTETVSADKTTAGSTERRQDAPDKTSLQAQAAAIKAGLTQAEDQKRAVALLIEQISQLVAQVQRRATNERLAMVFADRGSPLSLRYWSRLVLHAKALVASLSDAAFRQDLAQAMDWRDATALAFSLLFLVGGFLAPRLTRGQRLEARLCVGDAPTLMRQRRRLGRFLRWMLWFWAFLLIARLVPMGPTLFDLVSFVLAIPILGSLLSMVASRAQLRSIAPTRASGMTRLADAPTTLAPTQWAWRILIVLGLLVIPIAFLLGAANFARLLLNITGALAFTFMANQVARGYLFHGVRRREEREEPDQQSPETNAMSYALTQDEEAVDLSSLGNRAVLYVAGEIFLIGLSLLVVLPFFGISFKQLGQFLLNLWSGAQYGPVFIKLSSWFGALLVFVTLWFIVRMIRSYLRHRVLPHTGWDGGVQDAILATLTYGGFVLAFIAAVSAAGVDMARLAIIAGALSVGIGFGLQTIVNNVVSGLILLYERSIKPGDWVRVDGEVEGTIKQVRVRYTEIETFDRASVIVPNALMVGGSVYNMTLGNTMGRLQMQVGIDYSCNPRDVVKVLTEVATNFPMARKDPAPLVHFDGFADSSINFTIKVFLSDINYVSSAKTQLAFEVYEALQDKKMSIPFNQIDVRIVSNDQKGEAAA